MYNTLLYLRIKGLKPCNFCRKIVKVKSKHFRLHVTTNAIGSKHKHCGFQFYLELALLLISKAKEMFKIESITSYAIKLDAILNELHGIANLFSSVGAIYCTESTTNSFAALTGKGGKKFE